MSAAVSADHYSFPSGHASRVFFVAASVHFFTRSSSQMASPRSETFLDGWVRDGGEGVVKGEVLVGVWIWATVTAVSRILLGRHYVLDVAAGACLGVLEALFALRFLRFEQVLECVVANMFLLIGRSISVASRVSIASRCWIYYRKFSCRFSLESISAS
ncbi:putative lipid phosphate phosphatase beta [Raphanus sativus]|nr:putative lipid phosphate phosphatase beta [Raphanus sativus]